MKNRLAKKILAASLAAAMMIPSLVTGMETAWAEEASAGDSFIYDVAEGSITIQGYLGQEAELEIPDSINGVPVTVIGASAFADNTALTSVVIPEGVTDIGSQAFRGCGNLASVSIPEGVTKIGGSAFENCGSLTDIKLPESLKNMGDSFTFLNCSSLTGIIIPKNVETIYVGTFSGCGSLKEVTIPLNVGLIRENAFRGCGKLTDVYYAGSKGQWNNISIQAGNEPLTSAEIQYNSSAPSGGSGGTDGTFDEADLYQKKMRALQDLEDYSAKFKAEDYESGEWLELGNIAAQARYDIDQATSLTEIDEIVADAKKKLDAVRTKEEREEERDAIEKAGQSARNRVLPVLQAYYEEIKGYPSTWQKEMKACVDDGIRAVNNAYGPDEVYKKFEEAKFKIDEKIEKYEVQTGIRIVRKNAKEELENYKITQKCTADQKRKIAIVVQEGKASIDQAKIRADVTKALENAKAKIDQILSDTSADGGGSGQKATPNKTSITGKIKAQKKGFTVQWKKQTQNVDGYEVCYSIKKNFPKKGTVTKKVSKKTTTKLTVKKLKAKKKYYVRVRTYKKVNGKPYYSAWSAKKSVVTRK